MPFSCPYIMEGSIKNETEVIYMAKTSPYSFIVLLPNSVIDKQVITSTTNVLVDQSSYLLSFDGALMGFICQDEWNKILLNKFLLPDRQR